MQNNKYIRKQTNEYKIYKQKINETCSNDEFRVLYCNHFTYSLSKAVNPVKVPFGMIVILLKRRFLTK